MPRPKPPAPRSDEPSAVERALAEASGARQRSEERSARLRARWDDAAREMDRGNDEPYRVLAEAIRRMLRS
ncbi:MAG TPA: hypothetical protein VED40_00230 [Azospirillaceae bacterium]|nr:hypothetical protein [Azospirillaceae bacterium]